MVVNAKNKLSDAEVEQIQSVLIQSPEGRRWLADRSWKFFGKYYLNIDLRPHQIRWLEHLDRKSRAGVLAPVGHGKTFAITQVFALKKICYNRNIRIAILSSVLPQAKKNVAVLQDHLRKNPRIIADFGEFYVPGNWTKTAFTVKRDKIMKDWTVEANGVGGDFTGARFDLIILDDMVTEKNSKTETPRQTVSDYFDSTVSKRVELRGGSIVFIGTRYHYADKYGQFLKLKAIWDVLVEKAIIREPERYEIIELDEPYFDDDNIKRNYRIKIEGDPGECLDPINRPMEYLLLERLTNPRMFELVYQNNANADEGTIFKLKWFEKCKRDDLSYEPVDYIIEGKDVIARGAPTFDRGKYVAIVVGTDPAIVVDKKTAEEHDTSYFVTWTIGLYPNGKYDILHRIKKRGLTPHQKIELAKAHNRLFKPYAHFWESNSAGIEDITMIEEETNVPLIPHHTGNNKNDSYGGVTSLSVKFERSRIGIPYQKEKDVDTSEDMITEFHEYPNGDHDDQVMALWITDCGTTRVHEAIEYERKQGK